MKLLILIFGLLLFQSNKEVVGEYYNHFGQTLSINQDSTFICNWNMHMSGSWAKGKWRIKNDTVYFKVIPVYDTVRLTGKNDTLITSMDQKPDLITDKNASVVHMLSTYRQGNIEMETKLYYKSGKLISINKNGKLITKKQRFMTDKKFDPWFIKK